MTEALLPSRQTLEALPGRVFDFLMAVAEVPAIAAILATKGYSESEHAQAWDLLAKLTMIKAPTSAPLVDPAVRDAIVELDDWDNPNFAIIKAALDRRFSAQSAFVFDDLSAKEGRESVLAVATLLDRLEALATSPERLATRTEDQAALDLLASRGYDKKDLARLRGLVELARKVAPLQAPSPAAAEREKILLELHGWLNEWSTVARKLITRRDHQIRLGIAKRRASKTTGVEQETEMDGSEGDTEEKPNQS